jgi:dihydrofolate synthase/folylpolyglutamate synthase
MQLADWLAHQQAQHPKEIELGLERIRVVAEHLGLLPWKIPSIIVGGTNGKGSTVAFLISLAKEFELHVGTYTSPHLQRYNERIALDGTPVDDASLIEAFEKIEAVRGQIPLTFFEYGTLAALLIFAAAKVDVVILEVGLGGRLDATNLIDAEVAVLTSIGLDHTEWLGPTHEDIGREKAGIFRPGQTVLLASETMPQSVHAALAAQQAQALWPGKDFIDAELPAGIGFAALQGRYAAVARRALEALCTRSTSLAERPLLRQPLDETRVHRAYATVQLRGRFQRLLPRSPVDPEWILDVAHNTEAAVMLAQALASLPKTGRCFAVVGILQDKDAMGIGEALIESFDGWILCGLDGPRGSDAETLRQRLPERCKVLALVPDVSHGCASALALASGGDRIVVFGSFHVVGPAFDWLQV